MWLHGQLPAITDKQKRWAFEHCFDYLGFVSKGEVWCLQCGEVFARESSELAVSIVGDEAICPRCGRKLMLRNNRKRKHSNSVYYSILTTIKGFQVCRHYIVERVVYRLGKDIDGCREPYYSIREAVQNWIDENGREAIVARPCKPLTGYYDAWDFSKAMEIRRTNRNPYTPDKYNIYAKNIYPYRKVLPIIKRNGYTKECDVISSVDLFKLLLKDREAEMLIKNRQYDLLRYKNNHCYKEFCMPYAHSIKIANRNKYIVRDAKLWYDYLELLSMFGYDTHNAKYVCQTNLGEAHDRLLERKRRIEDIREKEKRRVEALQNEAQYKESKGRFFGIAFGNEKFDVSVIKSVADMSAEGVEMHHCVFDMGYYKRPESLIMSARDKQGNRIETVEVNLNSYKVVQSRGVCNKNTVYHDEIVKLVEDNMGLISACG